MIVRHYRLGLDLGSNSLGWWMVWLEPDGDRWKPAGIGPGGVRIFPDGRDPQSGTSNASDRRLARGARVRRDRFVRRKSDLMRTLIRHGLMPAEEGDRKALEGLDPYRLRAEALDGKLPLHHVGRALFHLNQRRGFQSNRRADAKSDEKGAIKEASRKLDDAMADAGAATYGVWLWGRQQKREGVRAKATITGTKAAYDFYPTRALLKEEFAAIWDAQALHYPELTEEAQKDLFDTIFHQRPLKDAVVGKCSLLPATLPPDQDPEGYRAPLAHPLAQRFRILQEVRNLRILVTGEAPRELTPDEAQRALNAFTGVKEVTFKKLRTVLKLPAEAKFNLEDDKREKLLGDQTAARLADVKRYGKAWYGLSLARQTEIVEKLLDEADAAALVRWLIEGCGLESEVADKIAEDTSLPEGHSRLGLRAIKRLLPHMERGLSYPDAAREEGLDHAKLPTGENLDRLPHYGEWVPEAVVGTGDPHDPADKRFGRFPNPTVHIGLGQLRRLVNALIDEHGAPTEIVLEFTRGLKMSQEQKDDLRRDQKKNQAKNELRAQKYAEVFDGAEPSPRDLLKMRLWEELNPNDSMDRKCPFSGKPIGFHQLIMSGEVEIEHLIPLRMSLDDSAANKTVCFIGANRAKKKRTPWQAFHTSESGYDWADISARAANLPKNKRWRFEPNAHERYGEYGDKDTPGFLARQLNETGWLARFAKQYLGAVTDPRAIWVTPGRLTSVIRARWGLNSLLPDHNYAGVKERDPSFKAATDDLEFAGVKNRADHRHHALDAFVVAMTDRGLMNRAAYASARDDLDVEKIEIPDPAWDGWRDDLKAKVNAIVVSHKPDHGLGGKLHADTAYGLARPHPDGAKDEAAIGNLVHRKPFVSLTAGEIGRIRDPRLRQLFADHWAEEKAAGVSLADALKRFDAKVQRDATPGLIHGVGRVRLLKPIQPDFLVPVADAKTGEPYKAYFADENFCIEIFETTDGKWRGEALRRFDVNQPGYAPRWRRERPDARLVMRLHKGDLVRLEHEGERRVMVVRQLEASNDRIKFAEHRETGNLQARHDTSNEIDPFRWLMAAYSAMKKRGAEKVRVDELGRVWPVKRTRSTVGGVEGVDVLRQGWFATKTSEISS